jgi:hypothetical protein
MGKWQRHIGARQGAKAFGTELNPTGVAETTTITREQRSEREVACADMTNGDHVKYRLMGASDDSDKLMFASMISAAVSRGTRYFSRKRIEVGIWT